MGVASSEIKALRGTVVLKDKALEEVPNHIYTHFTDLNMLPPIEMLDTYALLLAKEN